MKIPATTKKPRFYVATSLSHAFSSWGSLQEAEECVSNFRKWGKLYAKIARDEDKIVGIVETSPEGKIVHPLKD